MKKIVKSFILVAAAAMGFTACQKEIQEEVPVNEGTVQVTFVSGSPDTKTTVDTSGEKPEFAWGENETFAVLEQQNSSTPTKAGSVEYEKVDGKAKITATFGAGSYVKGATMYQYVTIYPASGYVGAESLAAATLSLPAEQTMATGSYDPAADLMVSTILKKTEPPTEAQMVSFTRMAAVVKMTLKGLELEAGDQVEQVIFTAAGKSLAGKVSTNLSDPHKFTVVEGAGVDNVTVNTTSSTDVYFTVLPTILEAGDAYTVTILTNKKIYIKQGTIPTEKSLVFEKGMVTRFNVNMQGIAPSDKWVLVKDASTLKEGDVVTIAAKNYNYVIGKQAINYPVASQTEVIKFGDYLYHPVATSETSVDNRIQHYTLLKRDQNRTAFDFYNDVDYEGDTSVGFAFANGSNYSPKLQSWCDKNTLFDVEIVDGAATLKASEIEKTNKWWRYSHSTSAGSRKFDCTSSVPTGNYQICLYKLHGAVGTIPVIDANVTVPSASTKLVIAEEGAAEPTAISEVVFNYVGNWTITPSTNAEWLNVAYDATKNCLTYTAEANTSTKRDATVTITATLEGQESLSWTFNVVQKGAPTEISIEAFGKLSKDENQPYKLTGRVVTLATNSTSSAYVLDDGSGNTANIKYLKTEDGDPVWGHDDMELMIGDIVTITTYAMGSKSGGSSALPSIYKGHYRLSATVGFAAGYTGGDVTITVETSSNGIVVAPETIEGTMAECDYATFAYSGGDTAVITFTSENTTSYPREAEVTFTCGDASVTVVAQQGINPANKLGYELVTDASTLAIGDEVIIVAKNADKALGVSTSTITSQTTFPSASIVKSGNVIYDAEEAGAVVFTLASAGVDGKFALQFTHNSSSYYLYIGSTALKGNTSLSNYTKLSIDIDSASGVARIINSASTAALITYNSTSLKVGATKVSDDVAADETNDIAIYRMQK